MSVYVPLSADKIVMLVLFRKLFSELKVRNKNESRVDKNSECFKHLQEHFSLEFHYYRLLPGILVNKKVWKCILSRLIAKH